jgi:DNA-directed RNA polymerase alpha subunit
MKEKINSDVEYAIKIVKAVCGENDINDIYIGGVFEVINSLPNERDKIILRKRFAENKTLREIASDLGLSSAESIRQIINRLLKHLRHPIRSWRMRVSAYVKRINDLEKENDECYKRIEYLVECINDINDINAKKITKDDVAEESLIINKSIDEIDLSAGPRNCLKRANYYDTKSIAAVTSMEDLYRIRNLGRKGLKEIINKMKENGYNQWVTEILSTCYEAGISADYFKS